MATRLRESNITQLKWKHVNLKFRHAYIPAENSKTKKAIPIPLNATAIDVIKRQIGKHSEFVFTYRSKPVRRCNCSAWRKALARSSIINFRWHDLRHTWASWHVQNGTSLHELQQLGGWSNFETVLRYAHLSSRHISDAADRIHVTNLSQLGVYDEEVVS